MKKLKLFTLLALILISCGKDEPDNGNGGYLQGTLVVPAQGFYGGRPYLSYNGKQYEIGEFQGQAQNEYTQVTNQMMTQMGGQSQNGQVSTTVSFIGTFSNQQVFVNGSQVMMDVVVFQSIRMGVVNGTNLANTALLKIPKANSNCNIQESLVIGTQSYSLSPSSSQQLYQLMNQIYSIQPHSFEGNNYCAGVFRVNYTGQIQGNSVIVQTISISQ